MERFRGLNSIFNRYEKNLFVEICSTGANRKGTSERGIIVTTDKRMLSYSIDYIRFGDNKYNINIDYDKVIDDKKFDKINAFLNKKIIGKVFEREIMFDMSFDIIGSNFAVHNHRDLYDELKKIIEK